MLFSYKRSMNIDYFVIIGVFEGTEFDGNNLGDPRVFLSAEKIDFSARFWSKVLDFRRK